MSNGMSNNKREESNIIKLSTKPNNSIAAASKEIRYKPIVSLLKVVTKERRFQNDSGKTGNSLPLSHTSSRMRVREEVDMTKILSN